MYTNVYHIARMILKDHFQEFRTVTRAGSFDRLWFEMSYVFTPSPVGGTVSLPPPPRVRGGGRHMTFQTGLAKACRLWWSKSYGCWLCLFTKGGCVTAYYFILFMMPITRPCLPRNLRNYLWMTKPQFRVKQIVTQALYQTLKTTKMNVKKLSG